MNGVIIGRFMPPHRGHQYLVEFAHNFVDDLYVLVCTLSSEPIPGELRYRWMTELFPRDHIIHITEEIPEASRGAPNAEQIWAHSVREAVQEPIHHVFASEQYGSPLAEALGAAFVPVDPAREIFPVSASLIRQDPYTHWSYIPEPVRPYFTRRVAVVTSSETLRPATRLLAKQFKTVFVNDYSRFVREGSVSARLDATELRRAQTAAEEALARHARRLLFCDRQEVEEQDRARYDMVVAEESGALTKESEAALERVGAQGTPVLRFGEISDSSLSRIAEAVEAELLRR